MAPQRNRHHTDRRGLEGIRRDNAINPARGEPLGVDVEVGPPFGSVQPGLGGPIAETGAAGEGAYVEFDSVGTEIPTDVGPRKTARIPTEKPLLLDELHAELIIVPRWWEFWKWSWWTSKT
ncbi:MAG: hypothetical protein KY475_13550 [Planctomycetes bacterium]|nr:hypothetical protein [Planctomycetota bacterium]